MIRSTHSIIPFLLLCLIGFSAISSSYLVGTGCTGVGSATHAAAGLGCCLGGGSEPDLLPLGFAVAGGVVLVTVLLFFLMVQQQELHS